MHECESCDYRHWPARCYSSATGHARLCELQRTRPDYRAIVARQMTGLGFPPCPVEDATAVTQSQAARIELCDFRRADCACQGKVATCLQGGYAARVVCIINGPDGGPCAGT